MALSPGTRLGAYEILDAIGSGGMGEVYRARDARLGRDVAIKVLPAAAAADLERRARFEREAKAVAALNHPNIVTIHAVEEADGIPFFAMEYVEGRTLARTIPPRGLPLEELLRIAIPLTDAVAVAHQRGILHRDIKPANVMITTEGRVKVLDFGLAKLREAAAAGARTGSQATMEATSEERILGTVAYMSPEQAQGKPVDDRSDVFSLGVLLYEMATGQRPFKGDTSVSVISAILKDTPGSVTDLRPELPRDLGRILKRALTKDPERRYQSAKDLRNDLQTLKEDLDSGEIARSAGWPGGAARTPRSWRLVAGIVLATVVLAVAATWWTSRVLRPARTPVQGSFEDVSPTSLTIAERVLPQVVAISPDGRYVAYVAVENGGGQALRIRQTARSATATVVPPADTQYLDVTFSPDGSQLYYVARPARAVGPATVYAVPVLPGTASRKVIDDVGPGVSFSPDGARIAFVRGDPGTKGNALVVANVDGTDQRVLVMRDNLHRFASGKVAWSADGRTIAAAVVKEGTRDGVGVVTVDVGTGAVQQVGPKTWFAISDISWPQHEMRLFVAALDFAAAENRQIWEVTLPDGAARRITKDLAGYLRVSVTADGRTLASVRGGGHRTIWVAPATQPDRLTKIPSVPDTVMGSQSIRWTNDARIVYTAGVSGNYDVWSVRPDGSDLRQLTTLPGPDGVAAFAPDGRYIVFSSNRSEQWGLWRMDSDGSGQTLLMKGLVQDLLVSPDSRSVFFTRPDQTYGPMYTVSIDGGQSRMLVGPPSASPDQAWSSVPLTFRPHELSPNGSLILGSYVDNNLIPPSSRIVIVPARGEGPVIKLDIFGPTIPCAWAPDGHAVTFVKRTDGVANLWRQPIDGGPATRLTNYTGDENLPQHAWSRDGRFLALVRGVPDWQIVLLKDVGRGRQ